METQGLLVGMMQCFQVSDIFRGNFTSRAEEPLGTYSYQTSFQKSLNSTSLIGQKIIFLANQLNGIQIFLELAR